MSKRETKEENRGIKRLLEAIEDMEGKAEFKNPMIAMRGAQ